MATASEITRKAKSNLTLGLTLLPPARRADMVVFYAYCRTIDDLADDPGLSTAARTEALATWQNGLIHGFAEPTELQREIVSLRDRRQIPTELLLAVIDGCRMDLHPQRFAEWPELSTYIWKVACAVGLVSTRIFGCHDPASQRYAVALGHALQLTNILRDIGEDLDNGGRIYLPLEDLARFDLTEADFTARLHDARFVALMEFQAARAEDYFRQAADVLPVSDFAALLPARIMAEIYQHLLRKMRADGFHVFEKRYRISKPRKLAILSKHLIARFLRIEYVAR